MLTNLERAFKDLLDEVQIPIPYFVGNGESLPWWRAILIAVFGDVFIDLGFQMGEQ